MSPAALRQPITVASADGGSALPMLRMRPTTRASSSRAKKGARPNLPHSYIKPESVASEWRQSHLGRSAPWPRRQPYLLHPSPDSRTSQFWTCCPKRLRDICPYCFAIYFNQYDMPVLIEKLLNILKADSNSESDWPTRDESSAFPTNDQHARLQ